jgi:hypothetical protein
MKISTKGPETTNWRTIQHGTPENYRCQTQHQHQAEQAHIGTNTEHDNLKAKYKPFATFWEYLCP